MDDDEDFFDDVGGQLEADREKLKDNDFIDSLCFVEILQHINKCKVETHELKPFWDEYFKRNKHKENEVFKKIAYSKFHVLFDQQTSIKKY